MLSFSRDDKRITLVRTVEVKSKVDVLIELRRDHPYLRNVLTEMRKQVQRATRARVIEKGEWLIEDQELRGSVCGGNQRVRKREPDGKPDLVIRAAGNFIEADEIPL